MVKQIVSVLVAVFLSCTLSLKGQSADSLFALAKKQATQKNYTSAQTLCNQLISQHPRNTDYQIFLGRLYSWQGKTDSAKQVFNALLQTGNTTTEVYDALTDAELWNAEYTAVIEHCKKAILLAPADEQEKFKLKAAKAYYLAADYKPAEAQLDSILAYRPKNKEARSLLNDVKKAMYKNYISVSHLNVSFHNPTFDSWNYTSVEYQRKHETTPYNFRVNYGNAYSKTAFQAEADAYPRFNKKTYLYLNAGASTSTDIFPNFNAGAELYRQLPYEMELSGGIRFLQFPGTDVVIFTGYLGKYVKKGWLAYRPFLVNKNNERFLSHTAVFRHYLSNTDNYISLHLIYGATPYTTVNLQDISKVNSQRIGIDFQKTFFYRLLLRPMISYEYEEYFPGLFRDRIYAQLTLVNYF